jgi:hypothetical protein
VKQNNKYAIKEIKKAKFMYDQKLTELLRTEIHVLKTVKNENVIFIKPIFKVIEFIEELES